MTNADDILAGAPARQDDLAVGDMSSKPSKRVAVLCCMDTRIDVLRTLGLERGEAHVLRNAGGLVTDDVIRSLSASQRLLGTEEAIVVMHEACGMLGASEDEFAKTLAADGVLPDWRLGTFGDIDQTLRNGLQRLRDARELAHHDRIRGFVFDPRSGTLRDVEA